MKTSVNNFKEHYHSFKSHKTWTKNKYKAKDDFLSFIDSVEHHWVKTDPKVYFERGKMWDYMIYEVPNDKKGTMAPYRGKKVVLMAKGFGFEKSMLILPIE